jgi:spore germination cell wall hydrolase CwlJ-like protein
MVKKYAALLVLLNLVLMSAWLGVEGVCIDRKAAQAFRMDSESETEVLQATSYLGVTRDQVSEQRTLELNEITRENRIILADADYENLLRIVEAEAGGEDKTGKMLVANVVLNRVESEKFPNTVTEVIFQSQNGTTQFSPISDGRFYQVSISRETIEAVEQVLTGADNSMGALYFVARKSADKTRLNWFDQNLTRLFAYGGHEFFS